MEAFVRAACGTVWALGLIAAFSEAMTKLRVRSVSAGLLATLALALMACGVSAGNGEPGAQDQDVRTDAGSRADARAADAGAADARATDGAANAAAYQCLAKKNPNRGLMTDMLIDVTPAEVGGEIAVTVNGARNVVATVAEAGVLPKSAGGAFSAVLGLLHEPDVSGIAAADLDRVSSLTVLKGALGDDEILVVRMFAGDEQIGGSLMMAGQGSACLPTP